MVVAAAVMVVVVAMTLAVAAATTLAADIAAWVALTVQSRGAFAYLGVDHAASLELTARRPEREGRRGGRRQGNHTDRREQLEQRHRDERCSSASGAWEASAQLSAKDQLGHFSTGLL